MKPNLFNSVRLQRPKSSFFDLSHDVKLSFNMGQLVPVCVMEALPTDKFNISAESLIRFAPMVAPLMHRVDASIHYFFVPNRIIWDHWEKFISNTPLTPGGTDIPAAPYINYELDAYNTYPLIDYMGLPKPPGAIGDHAAENVSALPFAAYQKIYDEYYRDQNLVDPLWPSIELSDGDNSLPPELVTLRTRAWEHDYFTACLPWAQKGPGVNLPIGSGLNDVPVQAYTPSAPVPGTSVVANSYNINNVADVNPGPRDYQLMANTAGLEIGSTTINDLRRAFKLQEWFERNARSGTRYVEFILAHFGIKGSDARLQRPEYICGIKTPVQISEVLNTTGTNDAPQGNMSGHGIGVLSSNAGTYTCEEHGWIIGIMSIMPKTAYYQGIPRWFTKLSGFEDYAFPTFAHLGEQEVKNREIYAFQDANSDGVFGYNPRYSEYKFLPSRVAGDFKSSLLFWHMARKFDSPPALNQSFVECVPRTDIFAVDNLNDQHMWVHVLNKIGAVRPLPKFGNPSFG